ncbi:MAG: AI-2E family transporter [Rickettsiaceae bacterium]|nr:AI-2E family transporter [Rickettsiaceae bacterium]
MIILNRAIFWGSFLCVALVLFYLVSNTLAPFIISFIIAYLLQPAIESNCTRFKLPRGLVVFGVFLLFISIFVTALVLLIPVIYQQVAMLLKKIPDYKNYFEVEILKIINKLDALDPEIADKITDSINSFTNTVFSVITTFANHLWEYTMATINFFAIIALVPVILYYFLRDWQKMVQNVESILPIKGKSKVRKIFVAINELLSAYIRGQLNICLLVALYYTIGLSIIGLDFALLLGIIAGILIIIPFIGALISFLLIFISGYFTFGTSIELLYLVIFFAIGHIIEGYLLTPKIIGDRIGLHPVWIIFAVFAAGSLFGFIGVLFAVPIAGIIKVLFSYFMEYYKSSEIYKG